MDTVFVVIAAVAALAYAWLPLRDWICARSGHKVGPPCLRMTHEDGSYETECLCLCTKRVIITHNRAFSDKKGASWVAPASGPTRGTSR